jgi:hypothetical protein
MLTFCGFDLEVFILEYLPSWAERLVVVVA